MTERIYRSWCIQDHSLVNFTVTVQESDLFIRVKPKTQNIEQLRQLAQEAVEVHRRNLEEYISQNPSFLSALHPMTVSPTAPGIVKNMAGASEAASVGPMAAVAGAIAVKVGEALLPHTSEVIVENGGDIYLASSEPRVIAIYAGKSIFTGRLGIKLDPGQMPAGVCTSAGTVGPSLSFGKADSAIVISANAALADAVATAMGNRILEVNDLQPSVEWAMSIPGVSGALAVKDDQLAVQGSVKLVQLQCTKG